MELSIVEAVLRSLRPNSDEVDSEVGTRNGAAYLHLKQTARPDRSAVIWSPGDRWFALDVDGRFSLNHFEEVMADDDAQRLLEKYVIVGLTYILGDSIPTSDGRFRPRVLRVSTEEGDIELTQGVGAALKEAIGHRGRQP